MNRLEGSLDAVLHLLDRQVVDWNGRMVCKVDDVEFTEYADGVLVVTGLLAGPAALLPRLHPALYARWLEFSPERAGRHIPGWIPLADVAELTSQITVSQERRGLVRPQPRAGDGEAHRRLGDLVGMRVVGSTGESLGQVIDVRLGPESGPADRRRLVATGLVVGRRKTATHLGYDRRPDQGPALLGAFVRWLHRDNRMFPLRETQIDWDRHEVRALGQSVDLTPAFG